MTVPSTPPPGSRRPRRRARGIDPGPRRLTDALEDAIAGLAPPSPRAAAQPPRAAVSALGIVFGDWEGIVGEAVARHVQPVMLADGVLTVRVDAPPWATQVRALGASILARVGQATGEQPGELRVVVRPGSR